MGTKRESGDADVGTSRVRRGGPGPGGGLGAGACGMQVEPALHPTLIPQKVTLEGSGRRFSQRNPPGVRLSAAGTLSLPLSCHAQQRGGDRQTPKKPAQGGQEGSTLLRAENFLD